MRLLIHHGAQVNSNGFHERSALGWAAREGHTKCVEFLLKHGADVGLSDKFGFTPLYLAMYFKHMDCIEAIVTHQNRVYSLLLINFVICVLFSLFC